MKTNTHSITCKLFLIWIICIIFQSPVRAQGTRSLSEGSDENRQMYLEQSLSSLGYSGYENMHGKESDQASWNRGSFPEYLYQIAPTWQKDINWFKDMKSFVVHNTSSKWGPPSPIDANWREWQERTGELPPDFSAGQVHAVMQKHKLPLVLIFDKVNYLGVVQWETIAAMAK